MRLYALRVKVVHPSAYQPHDCCLATVAAIYWDEEYKRMAAELTYDNGAVDWVPVSELGKLGYYEILEPGVE